MLPKYIPDYHDFNPGVDAVLYSGPWWDEKEINAATKALTTGKWLTSGEYVARFQNEFSRMFGVRHSHMVNSGSSANLVMMAALKERFGWGDDAEIIVSPVGFPTTISSIVQNNLKPVFVDIEWRTLNFDVTHVRSKITPRTRAIFVSPVLGNPPDIDELRSMCKEHGLYLIGDSCDSLGSRWNGEDLSVFYYAWSTSFYSAHHIVVGEGGMVSSNDLEVVKLARSYSTWGRSCYCVGQANTLPCGTCGKRFSKWLDSVDADIDHKYVFDVMGYNLKPLDLCGAIGLEQLKKFSEIDRRRKWNYSVISGFFSGNPKVRLAEVLLQADVCWFGVPLICDSRETRESLVAHLEANKIQTRPYFSGQILYHPGFKHLGNPKDYPKACEVMDRVFFLGVFPGYTEEVLQYIGKVIKSWETQNSPY